MSHQITEISHVPACPGERRSPDGGRRANLLPASDQQTDAGNAEAPQQTNACHLQHVPMLPEGKNPISWQRYQIFRSVNIVLCVVIRVLDILSSSLIIFDSKRKARKQISCNSVTMRIVVLQLHISFQLSPQFGTHVRGPARRNVFKTQSCLFRRRPMSK